MLVTVAWVFFRAENISDVVMIYKKIVYFDMDFSVLSICAGKGILNLALSFLVIGLLCATYLLNKELNFKKFNATFLASMTLLIIFLGKNEASEFIYFQF